MSEENSLKKTSFEVLDPPERTVDYGGKTYKLKPLSISRTLRIVRLISHKVTKFYDVFKENPKDSIDEKILKSVELIDDATVIKLTAILLAVTPEVAKKGFRLADFFALLRNVIEYEDIEKLFFEVSQIVTSLKK